jgi:hypothetical protein
MKKITTTIVLLSAKMDTKVRVLIAVATLVAFVLAAGAPSASSGIGH